MGKRIIALLLLTAMTVSLLAGCGGESGETGGSQPQETEGTALQEVTEPGMTEKFRSALEQALIMLTDSENCYVNGAKALVEDVLPVSLDQILYVPAAFVAESLGATVQADGEMLTVTYEGNTVQIGKNAGTITVNGTDIALPLGTAFTEEGVLVPAEEYCEALGTELHCQNGLILIGDGLEAGLGAATAEESQLMMSALQADLAPVSGMAVQVDGSYGDRSAVSSYIAIDPLDYPYSTEPDTLVAYAGSLYVENLSVDYSMEEKMYIVSMTVYNHLGYCYGSVEVYDENDNLKELERINPYEGQKSSVVSTLSDVAILAMDSGKALWNWDIDYLGYRTDLNSSKTDITVKVPTGGYIFITCNPTHSVYTAFYDMVYAFVQTAVCAADMGKTLFGGQDSAAGISEKLVEYIIDKLAGDPGIVTELAAEFERIFGGNSSVLDSNAYVQSAASAMLDAFNRAEIDIKGILSDAIKDQLSGAADNSVEEFLTKVLPVTEVALTSWKISSNTTNLANIFLDMGSVCKCGSLIIDISDWRTAYAGALQSQVGSGDRYDLLYLTDDNIPELVVLHAGGRVGSSATVYTYQNREVVNIPGPYGPEISIGFGEMQYLEYLSTIIQGNVSEGYTYTSCVVLDGDAFQTETTFEDDTLLQGGEKDATFYYNGNPVPGAYYKWQLHKLGIFNDGAVVSEKVPLSLNALYEKAKYVSAYTSGWEITESGIQEIYFFGW